MMKKKQLKHLGLILDGNRRWAKEHGLPTLQGHKKGFETLKEIIREAFEVHEIPFVSAYVFSTENWNRTEEEISYLLNMALRVTTNEVKELHKEGIRVRFLGVTDKLSSKLLKAIEEAEDLTKNNTKGTVALCFNYGGQQEIADAANAAMQGGKQDLTPEDIEQNLYASDMPPVDLMIRTSGEQRISGFMLWRMAYAEIAFIKTYWPDFSKKELADVIDDFYGRERRFGK